MLVGDMRVSKADGSQTTDPQRDALIQVGVDEEQLYQDHASGKKDDRPGLAACLKPLRDEDTLVDWKLDRRGRSLHHLVKTVHDLASARARGRVGGRPFTMTPAKVRTAMAAMGNPETKVSELCVELGISRQTLYRHVSPLGEIRADGTRVLACTMIPNLAKKLS